MPNPPAADRATPDQRLGPGRRLRTETAIDQAFDGGVRFPGHCMVMWLRKADDSTLRVGVVTSKRTFRRAVDRNHAKRRLREVFRRNRALLHGQVDLVLVARQALLDEPFEAVEKDFMKLAAKAQLVGHGTQSPETTRTTSPGLPGRRP